MPTARQARIYCSSLYTMESNVLLIDVCLLCKGDEAILFRNRNKAKSCRREQLKTAGRLAPGLQPTALPLFLHDVVHIRWRPDDKMARCGQTTRHIGCVEFICSPVDDMSVVVIFPSIWHRGNHWQKGEGPNKLRTGIDYRPVTLPHPGHWRTSRWPARKKVKNMVERLWLIMWTGTGILFSYIFSQVISIAYTCKLYLYAKLMLSKWIV